MTPPDTIYFIKTPDSVGSIQVRDTKYVKDMKFIIAAAARGKSTSRNNPIIVPICSEVIFQSIFCLVQKDCEVTTAYGKVPELLLYLTRLSLPGQDVLE